jgi:hypothetical protein
VQNDNLVAPNLRGPARDRAQSRSPHRFPRAQAEAGVMPWTPYRAPDDQPFGERAVVVSTGSVNSEEFIIEPCNQHRVITDVT